MNNKTNVDKRSRISEVVYLPSSDSEEDDDEVIVVDRVEGAVAAGTNASDSDSTKPLGMDEASWRLIKRMEEEGGWEEQRLVVSSVAFAAKVSTSSTQDRKRQRQERCDRAFAQKLQQDSDEKRKLQQRDQEQWDKTMALIISQEEDELKRANARRQMFTKKQALASLQPCQRQAVDYVKRKARQMHDQSLEQVESRVVTKLGFTKQDLHDCLDYICNDAPIVIHLKMETLSKLVNDTHYRNLFETNNSGGTKDKLTRMKWERDMFGNSYHDDSITPFDRPKYGCLNISGDISGVASARCYGNLFVILHQHVRYRSTFFNMDTGNFVAGSGDFVTTASLATNEYYAHILNGYNDHDLQAALNVCKSARVGGSRSKCSTYKEVQIHGPVCLATDIQALSVPGRERTADNQLKANVLSFQQKTNCNVLWQEDLLNPEDADTA